MSARNQSKKIESSFSSIIEEKKLKSVKDFCLCCTATAHDNHELALKAHGMQSTKELSNAIKSHYPKLSERTSASWNHILLVKQDAQGNISTEKIWKCSACAKIVKAANQ